LVANIPQIDQGETAVAKEEDPKQPGSNPMEPAVNAGLVVGAQPRIIQGQLNAACERDNVRTGSYRRVHLFSLKAGQLYTIDLMSSAFDAYLRLEDARGLRLAQDDDSGGALNARILYAPPVDGLYRVIATTYR